MLKCGLFNIWFELLRFTGIYRFKPQWWDVFQTGGQTTTSGTVLPQLPISHHESHVTAAQRPQPAASNGFSLPRLSDSRRPGRGLGCASLQTAGKKGRLTRRDKENNAKNTAPDLVPMPLSPEGRQNYWQSIKIICVFVLLLYLYCVYG